MKHSSAYNLLLPNLWLLGHMCVCDNTLIGCLDAVDRDVFQICYKQINKNATFMPL